MHVWDIWQFCLFAATRKEPGHIGSVLISKEEQKPWTSGGAGMISLVAVPSKYFRVLSDIGLTEFKILSDQCSWKVPVFVSFTDKNFKCLTEIKILSVRMSDTKIQDVLHRTRTCLTENNPVWHDVSFCQTKCLTSLKSFQEVCRTEQNFVGPNFFI